jgi:hypothetical protein
MQPGRGPGHQIAVQSVTRGIGAAALLVVGGVHLEQRILSRRISAENASRVRTQSGTRDLQRAWGLRRARDRAR